MGGASLAESWVEPERLVSTKPGESEKEPWRKYSFPHESKRPLWVEPRLFVGDLSSNDRPLQDPEWVDIRCGVLKVGQ